MSVSERARHLGIEEVLHYTSQRGVMGAVMKWALVSRQRGEVDDDVAFIFEGIWKRHDHEWIDYISLSLSEINRDLHRRSCAHFPDFWWGVMSFGPDILDDEGVVFTTTNNIHPPCQRGTRLPGFNAMFAPKVAWGYYGYTKTRRHDHDPAKPTDFQAEVLYPGELSLARLRCLYVPDVQHRRMVNGWCETYGRPMLPVEIAPTIFDP